MCALANQSKYRGCYNRWKEIKEAYDLKWTTSTDLDIFNAIMESKNQYPAMLEWLKDTCNGLPDKYSSAVLYGALTGLRVGELFQSIRLVQTDLDNYMNKDRMLLEHYKYREIFIRRTKKAYITVLTPGILELGLECRDVGENSLRHAIKRLNLHDHLKYYRKIYAIHLRGKGIAAETIDLLQGRVPKERFCKTLPQAG